MGRRVGKPEERYRVAIAAIKEKVLAAARDLEGLDQGHAKHVGIEVDSALHVLTHQRNVVDATKFEITGLCHGCPFHRAQSLPLQYAHDAHQTDPAKRGSRIGVAHL